MSDDLKLRSEPVTQAMFDRLPALLTAYQAMMVTGFDARELADEVKAKRIKAYKRPVRKGRKRSYSKYTKVSIAELVGFKV